MKDSCGVVVMVLLGVVFLNLIGCVSLEKNGIDKDLAYKQGYNKGFAECWERYFIHKKWRFQKAYLH